MRLATLALICLFAAATWSTGCRRYHRVEGPPRAGVEKHDGKGGPPPWAPAHGYRRKATHRYYPAKGVYYDLTKKVYVYLENGSWRVGGSLPDSLKRGLGKAEEIVVEGGDPRKHHAEISKHYGKAGAAVKSQGKGQGQGKGAAKAKGKAKRITFYYDPSKL